MEISKRISGDAVELAVKGRLDSYWSGFFTTRLTEVIHEGVHHLRMDLSEVDYISSAGIGVLVQFYKQLKAIQGSFRIERASPIVRETLRLCGLEDVLLAADSASSAPAPAKESAAQHAGTSAAYEIYEEPQAPPLHCILLGDPAPLAAAGFSEQHARHVRFPASSFALGLGAFGDSFESCRARFGEFLCVAGAAAFMPADGTNVADYIVAAGPQGSDIEVLYGLKCEGGFGQLLRFEARPDPGSVGLEELATTCLELCQVDAVGIVAIAETAGLTGAALRKPPVAPGGDGSLFAYPAVRDWFTFHSDRARSLALVVGVVARDADSNIAAMLRPLASGPAIAGHFHGAAFSYRPLPRGRIALHTVVRSLFESESLRSVLHLVHDDRHAEGAGESEFLRGACWVSPISSIEQEARA